MRLRKKFSMGGAICFALFLASAILTMTTNQRDLSGLFKLLAAILLVGSVILSATGLIIKKLHRRRRRKRRHRSHSREDRTEMAPYFDEMPSEEKAVETEYETEEATTEEEHVYQVYTMVPKTPKGKKRKKKEQLSKNDGE